MLNFILTQDFLILQENTFHSKQLVGCGTIKVTMHDDIDSRNNYLGSYPLLDLLVIGS